MKIRLMGIAALTALSLAACDRGGERVVKETTVIHDRPIIVEDRGHADRDHRDDHMDSRDRQNDHMDNRDHRDDHMAPPAPDRRDDRR